MKKIFVAATGQHVGKTTSTLGLVANLQEQGFTTGYCKPVGQKSVFTDGMTADKDAVLFAKVIGFNMDPDIHSPVILGKGVTADYIENPSNFDFSKRILHAADVLENNFDVVVYEGTGHPGVGSVVDLSNADVASMLNSGVIMIVEGGIGSTIDKLNMSIALFKAKNVPIHGVIVNKVKEDKYEKVKYYLSKKLDTMGIPLLG
ncbi:MAG: dethiobiotin synthase, partial [Saprospiraceae bacterium]|nr:dethiobiotin synthase [Saprospiraceae bacterium]